MPEMPVSKRLPAGLSTPQGRVVFRDEAFDSVRRLHTGLQRACIATGDRYPDLETWLGPLKGARALLYRYNEKSTAAGMVGYLWLYWKEE
jgi:hypothetical protein